MTENVVPIRSEQPLPLNALGLLDGVVEIAGNLRDREGLPTGPALARELLLARQAIANLRGYEERLNNALVGELPTKNVVWDGVPPMEKRGGKDRRKWDSHAIVRELAQVAKRERIDTITGEVQCSESEALMHVLEACARFEWRSTALRGKGLDPDEYCEVSPGRVVVQFLE